MVRRRAVVEVGREVLQQTERNVAVREGEPLEQEAAGESYAQLIRAPGLHAESTKLLDVGETLRGRLVEVLALLDLLKQPRLDEGAATDHDSIDLGLLDVLIVLNVGVAVTVAEEEHAAVLGVGKGGFVRLPSRVGELVLLLVIILDHHSTLGDVAPIGLFGVALLATAAVEGDSGAAGSTCAFAVLAGAKGELADDGRGRRAVGFDAGAELDRDGDLSRDRVHAADHALELAVGLQKSRTTTRLVDHVNRAAAVQINEAQVRDKSAEEVGRLDAMPGLVTRDLGTELEIAGVVVTLHNAGALGVDLGRADLAFVSLHEGPVVLYSLDKGHAQSHLGVGQLSTKIDTESTERKVALGSQGSECGSLLAEVKPAFLRRLQGRLDVLRTQVVIVANPLILAALVELIAQPRVLVHPSDVLVRLGEVNPLAAEVNLELVLGVVINTWPEIFTSSLNGSIASSLLGFLHQNKFLAAVFVLDFLHVAIDETALPAGRADAPFLEDRAIAFEGVEILAATLPKVLAQVVDEVASVTKSALARRELRGVGTAVAETEGIVKVAETTLLVLTLLTLLALLLLVAVVASVSLLLVTLTTALSGVVIINDLILIS